MLTSKKYGRKLEKPVLYKIRNSYTRYRLIIPQTEELRNLINGNSVIYLLSATEHSSIPKFCGEGKLAKNDCEAQHTGLTQKCFGTI